MNSFYLFFGAIVLFIVGYKIYNSILTKLFEVDDNNLTPAQTCQDNCDYIPASHWTVLFGHHFSSIAGAGPIIGPVLAVVFWGWFPSLLWIIAGTIIIGAVHDFGALMISVRHKGATIAEVSEQVVSKKAKILFTVFVWLALILVNAIFIIFAAKTFVSEPKVAFPAFGLIPIAILVGYLLYWKKMSQVKVTIIGLILLTALLLFGPLVSIKFNLTTWSIILIIYCFAASVTPVNILLQPRDYLSGYLLVFGILFGVVGIVLTHPNINFPMIAAKNISTALPIWPMLFVTVACGAISGFHSMVASGTTSKQMAKERHVFRIGYGAMVVESILAVIALISIAGGLSLVDAQAFIKSNNPIGAFGAGYGKLTNIFLGSYGKIFALMILNAFILTTLDTATRITRYLTQELFGLKNRYVATVIVLIASAWLAFSGEGGRLWPVFGASNQLVAALSLIVISTWLIQKGKTIIYTAIPALFMLVTTVGALIYKAYEFIGKGNYVLATINFLLIFLAIFLIIESARVIIKQKKKKL